MDETRSRFEVAEAGGPVSAVWCTPASPCAAFVFAHGAGAGMEHRFMGAMARRLGERGLATFRYQFPYMEHGRKRPDPPSVLYATVRAAVAAALEQAGSLPLVAGGKSMGGRMTSEAHARAPLPGVRGLLFLGFPLHPPRKPSSTRAAHLGDIHAPMLFVQGTRDDLADEPLIRACCASLGSRARLHVVDGADHSFHLLRSTGKTDAQALDEIADVVLAWVSSIVRTDT